jgi:DNA-binding transcriptional LysR family regulator
MTLDPRLLRPFVVLAEELHFGRAARRLHVTQPALSQQIARLEAQLGVRLLERSPHRVELSDAGRAVLEAARAAVQAADAAAGAAAAHAGGERGELRLGFSPGVHYLAQAALAELARTRPAVRISARQDNTGLLTRLVAAGELEVALGFCAEPSAQRELVCEERAVLAVGERHPLARRASVALAELREETFARGVRLLRLEPPVGFPVHLVSAEAPGPAALAFAAAVRRSCRSPAARSGGS